MNVISKSDDFFFIWNTQNPFCLKYPKLKKKQTQKPQNTGWRAGKIKINSFYFILLLIKK